MKKAIIGIVAIALVLLTVTSCKKTTTVNGGSWTFQDSTNAVVKYTVTSGIADVTLDPNAYGVYSIAQLAIAANNGSNYGSIVLTFFSLPTASGTYTITPNQFPDSGSHEIAINMILAHGSNYAQKNYNPSPTSVATAVANVTVMSNGYVKVAIPALEMINYYNTNDSGALITSGVWQTQAPQ